MPRYAAISLTDSQRSSIAYPFRFAVPPPLKGHGSIKPEIRSAVKHDSCSCWPCRYLLDSRDIDGLSGLPGAGPHGSDIVAALTGVEAGTRSSAEGVDWTS